LLKGFGKPEPFDVFRLRRLRLLALAASLGIFFLHPNAGVKS
jgi:hypothetical protein